ncbi:hypothetical protein TRIP_B50152 [uncultured Desulfatiglans sp.]|nr:hypothetical protein TRIP_B50152 [uncultured Desulfatiglans sp.]
MKGGRDYTHPGRWKFLFRVCFFVHRVDDYRTSTEIDSLFSEKSERRWTRMQGASAGGCCSL